MTEGEGFGLDLAFLEKRPPRIAMAREVRGERVRGGDGAGEDDLLGVEGEGWNERRSEGRW